jgi:AcrR family transcriptional regulator
MIDAAERLIADRGIGNVSVRDITSAAGVNTAAVNYHFGTKEGLLEAIVQRHAEQFGDRRAELLHGVPDDELTLRVVVTALVVATAELAADTEHGGRLFLACKQRMHADPSALAMLERYFEPYTTDFLRALKAVTPHLPRQVRVLRFALARDAVDRAFSTDEYPSWIERRMGDELTHDDYTEQVIDFLVAGLAAPA